MSTATVGAAKSQPRTRLREDRLNLRYRCNSRLDVDRGDELQRRLRREPKKAPNGGLSLTLLTGESSRLIAATGQFQFKERHLRTVHFARLNQPPGRGGDLFEWCDVCLVDLLSQSQR